MSWFLMDIALCPLRMGFFLAKGNAFEEEIIYADLKIHPKTKKQNLKKLINSSIRTYHVPAILNNKRKPVIIKRRVRKMESIEEVFKALVLGTRDYMKKNDFGKAAVGLSGELIQLLQQQ